MLAAEKKELGKYCSEAVGGIVDLLEVNLSNLLNLISLKKMFMKSKSMLEFKKNMFSPGLWIRIHFADPDPGPGLA